MDFLLSGGRIWADYVTSGSSGDSVEAEGINLAQKPETPRPMSLGRDFRVTTGRCNLQFFRGGSKVNYNIGSHHLS